MYLAEDILSAEQWAIKECPKTIATDITSVETQAELMKSLDHPLIPHVEEIFEDDTAFYIAMTYVHGRPLDKVLCEQGALPQQIVVNIGCQLCSVLSYLHTRRLPIIFRDIKPSNIIVRDESRWLISLLDFGIAIKCGPDADRCEKLQGTMGYAAPEQIKPGGRLDARTDIFGLGATMYALLTNRSPAIDGIIYPITCWNDSLSGELEQVILKCTQENPKDRYQSCEELKQALLGCSISYEQIHITGKQNPTMPDKNLRCQRCCYSPESCAPSKRERVGVDRLNANWERTLDLDTTLISEEDGQMGEINDPEKAKSKLQFRPDVKIIVCSVELGK